MTLAPSDPHLWGVQGHGLADRTYRAESVYRDMKERLAEAMLDRVEQAYPGARAHLRWSEAATPATQTRYTRATNGTAFGLEPTLTQFGPRRPGATTPVTGLFLAGTSTRWGPGTTGSMISGMYAAGAVLGRDLIAEVRSGRVFASDLAPQSTAWDALRASRDDAAADPDEDADPISSTRARG
jgi:phytoene dehydrogenase-like protein